MNVRNESDAFTQVVERRRLEIVLESLFVYKSVVIRNEFGGYVLRCHFG